MNWLKRQKAFKAIALVIAWAFVSACGVKGDPLPPEKPVEIGRGRPTYKKATEGIRIEKSKRVEDEEDEDEEAE